jgi:hypothetical protein
MSTVRTYECEGCDAVFNGTPEAAFKEGWDTPERFMSHCTCPNCPITTTLWWRVIMWQREHPDEPFQATPSELNLLRSYNKIWEEANGQPGESDDHLHSGGGES